jgi:hypothetical protein
MSEPRDEDALSWAGDDDPTLDASASGERAAPEPAPRERVTRGRATAPVQPGSEQLGPVAEPVAPPAEVDVAKPSDDVSDQATTGEREQMSSVMLVTLGIFGGVFLLYSVGWLISAFRPDAAVPSDAVGRFMFDLGQGLAVAAGPVWMAATLWLTRGGRPVVRIAMLLLGVLLILPWPFLRGV